MSPETLVSYQNDGMKARSHGLGHESNPFLVKDLMPQVTGDPVAEWREKAEAWLFGWLIENAWAERD